MTATVPETASSTDDVVLTGSRSTASPLTHPEPFAVVRASTLGELTAYRRLRREVFVDEQGMFTGSDADAVDDDPRTVVLVAVLPGGEVVGGVRLHPADHPLAPARDIGWWQGSRLVVTRGARTHLGVGAALVRAACATAEAEGVVRFDATIQAQNEVMFRRLGWTRRRGVTLHGHSHVEMGWDIGRFARLAAATKSPLGGLLAPLTTGPHGGGGPGFVGDDGAPVPGSDVVAACDAILPSMVERDPEWAGWCSVLVNVNDLCAMGANPIGLLDALGARDASFARRVLRGLTDAAQAWGVPVLGGHTQLGVPAALSVTALGRTAKPVPGGGGRAGDALRVTTDLGGDWRPRYTGHQWDSTSHRSPAQLRAQSTVVPALDPTAAKDVSMSGLVGTTGMLAEASGCRAVLDVSGIPAPGAASAGDWLTCFPGFGIISAHDAPSARTAPTLPEHLTSAVCGELTTGTGVGLRWPDGVVTEAITSPVTGMGTA